MIKSPSNTDLPLLRWMEANGIEVADDTAAVLGMTRKLLSAMMHQYNSLDSKSQEILQDIYMDIRWLRHTREVNELLSSRDREGRR